MWRQDVAITPDGWFDWMRRKPGPPDKVYSQRNAVDFYVAHSAVGYYGGWVSRLFSTARDAVGRYTSYAAVSAHGWIPYDGAVLQHYPLTASCWSSGSREANTRGVAFEIEGGAPGKESEPLTEAQRGALQRILEDIADWKGVTNAYWRRPSGDRDLDATLYEHRECVRFGSGPTACPSNRIPWGELLSELGETPVPGSGAKNGWRSEPPYQVLYNGSVPVLRVGGGLPGRISKLFGDRYLWLRLEEKGAAYWSTEEGD
jgi:hypothetical protein